MHGKNTVNIIAFSIGLLISSMPPITRGDAVSGYLLYCPCMGRFGNQAEQFLGALAFAKELKRTLVVPPWISYRVSGAGIELIPVSRHFNLTLLDSFHPTLDMQQFMDKLASVVWPTGSRVIFCHSPREDGTCQAKSGNPFGPFWDAFGVNFDREEFYSKTAGSLLGNAGAWRRHYPSSRWPVLAFMGAPASFPAQPEHLALHRHLVFNWHFLQALNDLMTAFDFQRPILAIHLRNNVDFTRACNSLLPQLPKGSGLFSSYQCFGPASRIGQLSMDTCAPGDATIREDVGRIVQQFNIKSIFVATDYDTKLSLMREAAPSVEKFVSTEQLGTDVFQDAGLMSLADVALLNCASSLSAFVRRSRDSAGLACQYLGLGGTAGWRRDEL